VNRSSHGDIRPATLHFQGLPLVARFVNRPLMTAHGAPRFASYVKNNVNDRILDLPAAKKFPFRRKTEFSVYY
jgi:hypothetical protein